MIRNLDKMNCEKICISWTNSDGSKSSTIIKDEKQLNYLMREEKYFSDSKISIKKC